VLGSIRSSGRKSFRAWQWAASGKHPVAKDYFEVGSEAPVVKAFSGWMEKGYHAISSKKPPSMGFCSWRFWAKGPSRETIICGLGRDSCDSVGRPYPLLVVGTGPLAGWEDAWDLLPVACEKTWNQMEYLSARRFGEFQDFEKEIQFLKPPHAGWSDFRSQVVKTGLMPGNGAHGSSQHAIGLEDRVASLANKTDFLVSLNETSTGEFLAQACLWHFFLRGSNRQIPNVVFMGSNSHGTYLAVFRRALAPPDFVHLWSGGTALEVEGNNRGGAVGGHRFDM